MCPDFSPDRASAAPVLFIIQRDRIIGIWLVNSVVGLQKTASILFHNSNRNHH